MATRIEPVPLALSLALVLAPAARLPAVQGTVDGKTAERLRALGYQP